MSEEAPGEPVVEPIVEPVVEAAPEPVVEGQEASPAGEGDPPAAEPQPDKKSPVNQLKGRVGHLTKIVSAKDAAIAEKDREIEAYKALLAANAPDGETPPVAKPETERRYTRAEVEAEAAKIAEARDFNAQADAAYAAGLAKHKDAFDEAVGTLRDLGCMTQPMVEAALATGDAAEVLFYLGNDADEAARINALPPIKMGVELAKIATKLSTPKGASVSSAPAPIKPLGGSAKPEIDVYDPKLSMADYAAKRAAQGAQWAKPPRTDF